MKKWMSERHLISIALCSQIFFFCSSLLFCVLPSPRIPREFLKCDFQVCRTPWSLLCLSNVFQVACRLLKHMHAPCCSWILIRLPLYRHSIFNRTLILFSLWGSTGNDNFHFTDQKTEAQKRAGLLALNMGFFLFTHSARKVTFYKEVFPQQPKRLRLDRN